MVKAVKEPVKKSEAKKEHLSWPLTQKEIGTVQHFYRMEQMGPFEWQCYQFSTDSLEETPIGKPDLIELVRDKLHMVMKHEGRIHFIAKKAASA